MVPRAGLEPARPFGLGILSPLCLPFHHRGNYVFAGGLRGYTFRNLKLSRFLSR